MTTLHPAAVAFPNGATTYDTIQQALASGLVLAILTGDALQDYDFGATGAVVVPEIIIVKATGLIYRRDATSVAAHNGVTVLVDMSGKRYLSALSPSAFINVLDRTNTPPSSSPGPAAGDRYIVGPAPTGAWASNADDLTFYDDSDWVFVSPEIGQTVYNRASGSDRGDWQWGEAGAWTQQGALSDTVYPASLKWPWGAVAVSETATPPGGTPALGTLYIVGGGATGAWASQDADIAEADGAGGWTFHTPYNGAEIFDNNAGIKKQYNASTGVWDSASGAFLKYVRSTFVADTSGQTTQDSGAPYTYSDTTAPTTTRDHRKDGSATVSIAAPTGSKLRFVYQATFATGGGWQETVALFRGTEINAIAWQRRISSAIDTQQFLFNVTAPDASAHTYHVRIVREGGVTLAGAMSRRQLECMATGN